MPESQGALTPLYNPLPAPHMTGSLLAQALGAGDIAAAQRSQGLTQAGQGYTRAGLADEAEELRKQKQRIKSQRRGQAAADIVGTLAGLGVGFLVPGVGWMIAPAAAQIGGGLASGGQASPNPLITGALGLGALGQGIAGRAAARGGYIRAAERTLEPSFVPGTSFGPTPAEIYGLR